MQTVFRFSRCGAGFGKKKSPHNNRNLTIPSGMALVRVRYVAIRKSKTCSGSFRSRAGTLSKYVILNCWNRLPQKSSCVNKKVSIARHFRQRARKHAENFGKKREPDGLVLLICFLPAAPDTAPAPHPPARQKCPPGCDTRRPERPDLPLPGTRYSSMNSHSSSSLSLANRTAKLSCLVLFLYPFRVR